MLTAVLQRGRHCPVSRDAHGREEEHARVHVHHCDREYHLAHDVAERPAEITRGFHSPEGQNQHKLEVCSRQVQDEQVDRGRPPSLPRPHQVKNQHVANQTHGAHERVDERHQEAQRMKITRSADILQLGKVGETHVLRLCHRLHPRQSVSEGHITVQAVNKK